MRHLLAIAVLLGPATALACSFGPNAPWAADPSELEADVTAPGPLALAITGVKRGVGPQSSGFGCGQMMTSCDDLGLVNVTYDARDDRTLPVQIAVELELVDGELPDGLVLPDEPVYLERLWWSDGATDDQEPIDFRIRARAVDLAGNRGPWSDPVRVTDAGTSGGCSASAGGASLLALAWLALAARRRR